MSLERGMDGRKTIHERANLGSLRIRLQENRTTRCHNHDRHEEAQGNKIESADCLDRETTLPHTQPVTRSVGVFMENAPRGLERRKAVS